MNNSNKLITNESANYLEKNKIVNKGSIIIGYPGIGKSTLANVSNGYIDLERVLISFIRVFIIWKDLKDGSMFIVNLL